MHFSFIFQQELIIKKLVSAERVKKDGFNIYLVEK